MPTLLLDLDLQASIVVLNHTVVGDRDLHLGATTLPILYIPESSFKHTVQPFDLFGKAHDLVLIVINLGFKVAVSVSLDLLPGQLLLPVFYLVHPALESPVESLYLSAGYTDFGVEFLVGRCDLGNLGQLVIQLATSYPPVLNFPQPVLKVVFKLLVLEFPLLLLFQLLTEFKLQSPGSVHLVLLLLQQLSKPRYLMGQHNHLILELSDDDLGPPRFQKTYLQFLALLPVLLQFPVFKVKSLSELPDLVLQAASLSLEPESDLPDFPVDNTLALTLHQLPQVV